MAYAFFPGCKICSQYPQYGTSTRAVLSAFNIDYSEPEFNCCGYPFRDFDQKAFLLLSARNIAIAEKRGLDILTPCQCCFGTLKHAQHLLNQNAVLKDEINDMLKKEGLNYHGGILIKHLLTVLLEDVGIEQIHSRVKKRQSSLKIAVHYGCHVLRPGNVVNFDNPMNPTIFEKLVRVTGAECVSWGRRLECCGYPVHEKNPELSLKLMKKKLESALDAGADSLCTACTYCQIQFDTVQASVKGGVLEDGRVLPAILYPQLLGRSLGIPDKALGLGLNHIGINPDI